MQRKRLFFMLVVAGTLIVMLSAIALALAQPVHAQCGSQASSCKNCHEVQAQKAVNNDGTSWHQAHAFGDFCYLCHAGNSQATDKDAAHAGMVAPLSDVKAACSSCHAKDYMSLAQGYATTLGVQIGAGASSGNATAAATQAAAAASGNNTPAAAPMPTTQASAPEQANIAANDANLTDYVQRYNAKVLNQQPTNWGNLILGTLLVLIVLAGGLLVNRRERWISVSFRERKPLEKGYPDDVVGIAAQAGQLRPAARSSLARLLSKPGAADLLSALDKLSADDSSEDKNQSL